MNARFSSIWWWLVHIRVSVKLFLCVVCFCTHAKNLSAHQCVCYVKTFDEHNATTAMVLPVHTTGSPSLNTLKISIGLYNYSFRCKLAASVANVNFFPYAYIRIYMICEIVVIMTSCFEF